MRKQIFILIGIAAAIVSCETEVDLDLPPNPPKLVINSFLIPDSTVQINVTKSQFILDEADFEKVTDATVILTGPDGQQETLSHEEDGNYISQQYIPDEGDQFGIEVRADGLETATSFDAIPSKTEVLEATSREVKLRGESYIEISIKFEDEAVTENYYEISMSSIQTYFGYDNFGNPVDTFETLANIYFESNDIVLDDQEEGLQYERANFSDLLFDGQQYTLKLLVPLYSLGFSDIDFIPGPFPQPANEPIDVTITLLSVSSHYYQYSRTYRKYLNTSGDPFAQPVQVYNNIVEGFGIFAGYSKDTHIFEVQPPE